VQACSFRNSICHQSAEDLSPAIEAKPDAYAGSLLFLCIPLGGEERESGGHCGFENAEEEANSNGTRVVGYCRHATEDETPHDDAEGGVLCKGKHLKEPVCGVLPRYVA